MIDYDKYGKMKYNSEFHGKHGTSWSYEDLKYLMDWYDVAGAEEMSFALERTLYTIALKVCELRKKKEKYSSKALDTRVNKEKVAEK